VAILLLIIGIILFIGLVVVHEFGHFIMARRNGVVAEEFGIFFPPRLYKRKMKGGWLFTINALPLGGFVRMKGEHDADTEPGTFGAASLWAKTKIMAAGVVMNLLTAFVLFMILAWVGMPQLVENQFTVKNDTKVLRNDVLASYIEPGSPAAKAGITIDDHIVALGAPGHEQQTTSAQTLPQVTKRYAGKPIAVTYIHQGQRITKQVTLRSTAEVTASKKTDTPKGYLGIIPNSYTLQRSTWSAPVVAVGLIGQFTALTFQGLGHAVAGVGSIIAGTATNNTAARQNGQTAASSQIAGPVGIFVILKDGSLLGYQFMLLIIAIISLTLAIMNILPIPALDGGRLWITLISRWIKRPLSAHVEEVVNASGFVFLLLLMVLIVMVDIKRFF
jgi:regulator of sigma E protease